MRTGSKCRPARGSSSAPASSASGATEPFRTTLEAQAALCFDAIAAILGEAGLGLADLIRLNAYVTGREHLLGYMAARDRYVPTPPPASTLMIVAGFARPEFLVEIEAVAGREP